MNTLPSSDEDLFDDCPICMAEREVLEQHRYPTARKLRQAFQEAAKLPGVVSGSFDPWPAKHGE